MLESIILELADFSGSIPKEIFNISSLESISFALNNLVGTLPSSMGHGLLNLEGIHLEVNMLVGAIPDSISNCSKLAMIDFGENHLSGPIPTSLAAIAYGLDKKGGENNILVFDLSLVVELLMPAKTALRSQHQALFDGNDFSEPLTWARFEELNNDLFRKRMVREAEEFAEKDKKDKLADKLESDEKEKIETATKEALQWLQYHAVRAPLDSTLPEVIACKEALSWMKLRGTMLGHLFLRLIAWQLRKVLRNL
nr:receptor kinase-like protein Xa21 isoform X1 [Ipomoea batatas]